MAEIRQEFLRASTTTLGFATGRIFTAFMEEVFLETVVTCTAANLITDFTVGGCIDNANTPVNMDNAITPTGVLVSVLPAGYSFNNGFQVLINNPAIGTTKIVTRHSNMPKVMGSFHSYTSGGGTVSLIVTAYGWGRGTVY